MSNGEAAKIKAREIEQPKNSFFPNQREKTDIRSFLEKVQKESGMVIKDQLKNLKGNEIVHSAIIYENPLDGSHLLRISWDPPVRSRKIDELRMEKPAVTQETEPSVVPVLTAPSASLNLNGTLKEMNKMNLEVAQSLGKISFLNIWSKEWEGLGMFTMAFTGPKKHEALMDESRQVLLDLYNDFATDLNSLNRYMTDMKKGNVDGSELKQKMENYFNSYNEYLEGMMKLRGDIEKYTINTPSEVALAGMNAAFNAASVVGVVGLAKAAGGAIVGGAVREGIRAGSGALARQAAKNALKAMINRNAIIINTVVSGGMVGAEAWQRNEMNAALKKFQEEPAEGITAMTDFFTNMKTSLAKSDNRNKDQIMKTIDEGLAHLKEMKSKLDGSGPEGMKFKDVAITFATTFAISMLFEAGLGAGGGIVKAAKPKSAKLKPIDVPKVKEMAPAVTAKQKAPETTVKAAEAPKPAEAVQAAVKPKVETFGEQAAKIETAASQETKAAMTPREQSDMIRAEVNRKAAETEAGRMHQYLTGTPNTAEALSRFQEGKFGKALAEVGERYSGKPREKGISHTSEADRASIDFTLINMDKSETWLATGLSKETGDVTINIYLRALRETAKQYDITVSMAKNSDEVFVFLAKDQDPKLFLNTVKERMGAMIKEVDIEGVGATEKARILSSMEKMSSDVKDVKMTLEHKPNGEVSYLMESEVVQNGKYVKVGGDFDAIVTEIELEANLSKMGKNLEKDARSLISKFDSLSGESVLEIEGLPGYVSQVRFSFDRRSMVMLDRLTEKLGKGNMQVQSGEIGPSVLNLMGHPLMNRIEYAYYSALRRTIKDNNIILGKEKDGGPLSFVFKTKDGSAIEARKMENAIIETNKLFEAEMGMKDIKISSKNFSGATHTEASLKVMGGLTQNEINMGNKGIALIRTSPSYWRKVISDSRVMDVILRSEGLPKSVRNTKDFMTYLEINKVKIDFGKIFNFEEIQRVDLKCKILKTEVKVI